MTIAPDAQADGMDMFTIYSHPKDYPQGYVVRRWVVGGGHEPEPREAYATASLEDARSLVPQDRGLVRMPATPGADDPTILETWF